MATDLWTDRHPSVAHFREFFDSDDEVSRSFDVLARELLSTLNDGQELSACLRKLLEAKECAVRQVLIDGKER